MERGNGLYSKEYHSKNPFTGINSLATPNNILIIVAFALLIILIVMVILINRVSNNELTEPFSNKNSLEMEIPFITLNLSVRNFSIFV